MIPTQNLLAPYRQPTENLCGIVAYAMAVRPFCPKEVRDFLRDIWAIDQEVPEPTTDQGFCEFYELYGRRLFNGFPWDGSGSKMFRWLRSLQGPNFREAEMSCLFRLFAPPQFAALDEHLRSETAVACVAVAFDQNAIPVSHIVNVWHDGTTFCLRDSARAGPNPVDDTAATLLEAVQKTRFHELPNGRLVHGMSVQARFN